MSEDVKKNAITIADVAATAKVSRTTVSHALNGKGQVNSETQKRIQAIAEQLGYRPNRYAQALRSGGNKTIALISSIPAAISGGVSKLGFMMEIATVAASYAMEHGLFVLLVPSLDTKNTDLNHLNIDGAILLEPSYDDEILKKLSQQNIPFVSIGRPSLAAEKFSYVDLASYQTTENLLSHLQQQGAKQIALMIGQAQRTSYLEAEQAYRASCQAHHMSEKVYAIAEAQGEIGAKNAVHQILKDHPNTDAILVLVDTFASGVMQYLQENQIAVPKQIKVATRYNGVRAQMSQPPLTAVNLHLDEVAKTAIDLLIEQLQTPTLYPQVQQISPPEIIQRESSLQE